MEKYEYKAQSKRLLEMMIHSIYSQKEIFLRELISNASDAMDKLYYMPITEKNTGRSEKMEIRIRLDKERRLLRISDNGIGMNAKELEQNLGTIAKSDSAAFRDVLKDVEKSEAGDALAKAPGADSLIGQFGVGFYSAFMVADKVTVISRKYNETQGWRFDSTGADGYTISPYDKKTTGTDVILHIRPEEEEGSDEYNQYLREYPLYKLIKKYSDYIRYPIRIYMPHPEVKPGSDPKNPEYEEKFSYETVNSMVPLWQRSKSEVTREQQIGFYKEHFGEQKEPQDIIFADVEGNITYKALLYIPGSLPKEYGTDDFKAGLELYSSNVKIMDSCEQLLPEEYNFIRGVVDSPDLSLNISREMLQKDRRLQTISNSLSKKVRALLVKKMKDDREEYEKFHEIFGHHLKVCAMDDYGKKKDTLGELLLFYSSQKKKLITLDEYVADMKPEQKYIYYACGDSIVAVDGIPQIEVVREHDMDVLYFLDKADVFVARMFGTYKEKQMRSVENGDLGLEKKLSEEEQKAADEKYKELLGFIQDTLGTKVDSVVISNRLKSHPVCLSNGAGITFEMEAYFRRLSPDVPVKAKYILEINAEHAALKALETNRKENPEKAAKYCEILYQQARMIAGLPVEDPSGYTDLLCSLWD